MNLHPIFVHFPIALLTLYVFIEILRFKKVMNQSYIFYIKAVLVMAGGLGLLAALYTGGEATQFIRPSLEASVMLRGIRGLHENFADLTTAVFGLIAAAYGLAWLNRDIIPGVKSLTGLAKNQLWLGLMAYSNFMLQPSVVIPSAILGFIVLTITGGLGGILVYGDKADPFFAFFYHLLVK